METLTLLALGLLPCLLYSLLLVHLENGLWLGLLLVFVDCVIFVHDLLDSHQFVRCLIGGLHSV